MADLASKIPQKIAKNPIFAPQRSQAIRKTTCARETGYIRDIYLMCDKTKRPAVLFLPIIFLLLPLRKQLHCFRELV